MKRIISTLALAVCIATATAFAQDSSTAEPYFKKGDWLVGFQGSYNHIDIDVGGSGETFDLYYASGGADYFLTNSLSSGVNSILIYVPDVAGIEVTAVGLEWNARYHLQFGKYWLPYAGVSAGYAWGQIKGFGGSTSDHLTTLGGSVGTIIPINDNVYFDIQLKYTDFDLPVSGVNLDTTQILLGLKIKL